jgi:hypothetical protein
LARCILVEFRVECAGYGVGDYFLSSKKSVCQGRGEDEMRSDSEIGLGRTGIVHKRIGAVLDRLVFWREFFSLVCNPSKGRMLELMASRKSAGTLAPLLIGAVLLVLCCFWEAHIDSLYALFPHPVMDNLRGFSVILRATFLVGMLYYSTLILWPQEIQVLFTTDPIKIGLYSIALGGGGGPGGLLAGWLLRFNCARWFLVSYATCLTLICGLQAVISNKLPHIPV